MRRVRRPVCVLRNGSKSRRLSEAALEKMKVYSARIVVVANEQITVTTEYEERCSSVEQRVCFTSKEIASLEAEVVNVTQSGTLVRRRQSVWCLMFSPLSG